MPIRVKGAAIGIDLGTTYSCAAAWFDNKNRVEIIPNEQGNKITPSCIAFNDTELSVGEGAKNQIARNPTNTVFGKFADPQVQKDIGLWPFKVIKGPMKEPTFVVEYKGELKHFSPEELSAMVLQKMKLDAEDYIGREVTDAVITVPAYFNNQQREATKKAGTLAGLNVLRLLNEPTAAAIAYGVDNMADKYWRKKKNVLVFDLGGGTFDVSLLEIIKSSAINVKAVGGDTHLGGEDFDKTLVNYCVNEFKRKHGEVDVRGNARAMARLKVACEKAKRDLSSTSRTSIEIDCLYNGIDFSTKISRAKFEELNSVYFEKCVKLVQQCLIEGKTKKEDVNEVVVVGGSTRIPKVRQMVEDIFQGKTICKSMNGDEAVAFGAAILAASLSGTNHKSLRGIVLRDIGPHSLGIEIQKPNGEKGYMHVLIPRNTSIPVTKKHMFRSRLNSTRGDISVYLGERVKVKENVFHSRFALV
ncbi:heat shock cognate 70 kDa protein-like protein [Tanacetum coccineum]|uniref:Heat shock cognate 70 kDa protein-like protein n=1 Tax=Tanacetum coccineum TaxID=301880 RepID=A0ABQ5HJF2_9ASTR